MRNGSIQGKIHWNPDLDQQIKGFPADLAFNQPIQGDSPDTLIYFDDIDRVQDHKNKDPNPKLHPVFSVPGPHPSIRVPDKKSPKPLTNIRKVV